MNDNRYSNKEQSWWQHLSASSKVYSVMALVCLAIVGSVGYFVNASNPAKAGYFMMAVCFFVIVVMWFGAIILRTIDTKNNERLKEQMGQMVAQAEQLNKQAKQMIEEETERRRIENEYLEKIDRDGKWEDEAEKLDQQKQAEEEILKEPTPEELEQIKAELSGFNYELDSEQVLAAHYYRQMRKAGKLGKGKASVGKVVAEVERIHTGKIKVNLINAILAGEVSEEAASPEGNTGDQPKNPTALPAPQPQFLLEQKPDPPVRRPIAEQLAELGLPESAGTFLEYLLNVGNCPDYKGLKRPLRKQLDAFVEINAS